MMEAPIDEPEEEFECGRPCDPVDPCKECEGYWARMVHEGYWNKERHMRTNKGWYEPVYRGNPKGVNMANTKTMDMRLEKLEIPLLRLVKASAASQGLTLKQWVIEALRAKLESEGAKC